MTAGNEPIDVSVVDATSLLPLSPIFFSNQMGDYLYSGLLVMNGDTANPFGSVNIAGSKGPFLQADITLRFPAELQAITAPQALIFFRAGIDITPLTNLNESSDGFRVGASVLSNLLHEVPTSLPINVVNQSFLRTDTEVEFPLDVATIAGPFDMLGNHIFASILGPIPDLLHEGVSSFDKLVTQTELQLSDIGINSVKIDLIARTRISGLTVVPLPPAIFLFTFALIVLRPRR